jgi:hypothetical protein
MSVILEAASKVHQKQLDAAARSEDLVLKAFGKVRDLASSLQAKAPSLPEQVAGPVEKVTAPVQKVVGSRSELRAYVTKSTKDWLEVQQSFQRALVSAVLPTDAASQQA